MEQQEKIKAYLRGQLSAEDAAEFLREMDNDSSLADHVRFIKKIMLIEELKEREIIRQSLEAKNLPNFKYRPFYVRYGMALTFGGIVLLLVIIGVRELYQPISTPSAPDPADQVAGLNKSDLPSVLPNDDNKLIIEEAREKNKLPTMPFKKKIDKAIINDTDLSWMRYYKDTKSMGYSGGLNPELINIWELIEKRKLNEVIEIADTIKQKDDKIIITIAFAYAYQNNPQKALGLLDDILKAPRHYSFRTSNTARLVAAKCYYFLARENNGDYFILHNKAKKYIEEIKALEVEDKDHKLMGDMFWKEVYILTNKNLTR
jgi:hypothetical protein